MLHSDVGASFVGCTDQSQLTPFQRQVIEATKVEEAKEQERQQEERMAQSQGNDGRVRNSRRNRGGDGGSSGLGSKETVRYINREENPDHPIFADN